MPAAPVLWPRLVFGLALLFALLAACHGITWPWRNDPTRGLCATAYSAQWVYHHTTYGLGVTLGAPVFHVDAGSAGTVLFNWHHPPFYPLWLAGFAAVLGNEPWVLRLAHLLLFVPSVPALYLLVKRHADRTCAAVAVLLYATCPYATYFGLMVLQDGITLSLAIVACWAFQLHLDRPKQCRAWWPGLAFFFCCSNDIPGYFTGFALFALALMHAERRRALRSVVVMFAVSLVAFGVTAIHYGTFLGGPIQFVREMLEVGRQETEAVTTFTASTYLRQFRAIFFHCGGGALITLALLGAVLGFAVKAPHARRLSLLGLAVALPGIANYLLFPSHAPQHLYWPLPAFGGLAIAAAAVPATGLRLWHAAQPGRRAIGALLLLACAGAVGFGAVRSHTLIGEGRDELGARHEAVRRCIDGVRGCRIVLTTAATGCGQFFGEEYVVGDVTTLRLFESLLDIGRAAAIEGEVGFVLEARHLGTPLHARLMGLAEPKMADGAQTFRFRVLARRS